MNQRLREALEIISDVDAEDASVVARGNRAHARVTAMIEYAEQVTGIREQALIANLLTLAGLNIPESDAALQRTLALLSEPSRTRMPDAS
jgi:hypothetical protein